MGFPCSQCNFTFSRFDATISLILNSCLFKTNFYLLKREIPLVHISILVVCDFYTFGFKNWFEIVGMNIFLVHLRFSFVRMTISFVGLLYVQFWKLITNCSNENFICSKEGFPCSNHYFTSSKIMHVCVS